MGRDLGKKSRHEEPPRLPPSIIQKIRVRCPRLTSSSDLPSVRFRAAIAGLSGNENAGDPRTPTDQVHGLVLAIPFAQIVVRRAGRGALGDASERIELLFAHGNDAAVGAHSHRIQPLVACGKHPVPALELGCDPVDRALDAKRLVAADAERGLFFLDDPRARRSSREIDLRRQRDHFLRTRALAQAALYAGVFDKFEGGTFGIIA